jgi:hypothetical protein
MGLGRPLGFDLTVTVYEHQHLLFLLHQGLQRLARGLGADGHPCRVESRFPCFVFELVVVVNRLGFLVII